MSALHESLRKQLEKTVIRARDVAEEGARAALGRLGVASPRSYAGLTDAERDLWKRLRARGKQIGDARKATGEQETGRLAGELAYEYWHRMLFARFLAENDLLMHPDGVSVSLADCEELARDEGLPNGWLLAERWASRMLPEIFRPADPLLQVPFAPEHERALEQLLEGLPAETFRASDALGWVYQFWQARRKEEVNRSGVKIGADELPAVTQLFTEPYMVHFLLDNTLGAWWAGRHPGEEPPVAFEYLRRLEDGAPAAGTFDGWPKRAADLKVLDPCCGSGHFLVAAFHKLVPMRMREEGLSAREACDAVLRENLHGLEIDPRCTQIAVFAVALSAWRYVDSGGYRAVPTISIACSGTAVLSTRDEWRALAEGNLRRETALDRLYTVFREAPTLGSLLNPQRANGRDLLTADIAEVSGLLFTALRLTSTRREPEREAAAVVAQDIGLSAKLLSGVYTLVITNVPYLGRGKQSAGLQAFCDSAYPHSKHDLATVFVERCLALCAAGGSAALVTPQNWLAQTASKAFREHLLKRVSWNLLVRLGTKAFGTITGDVVNVALLLATRSAPDAQAGFAAVDVSDAGSPALKALSLFRGDVAHWSQSRQLSNPDSRIAPDHDGDASLLAKHATSHQGIKTTDDLQFVRGFWELPDIGNGWAKYQGAVNKATLYGGREHILFFEEGRGKLRRLSAAQERDRRRDAQGINAWGRCGVAMSLMGNLVPTLYTGELFDSSVAAIVPEDQSIVPALWAFCSSAEYQSAIRKIDQRVFITNATLVKVPFDAEYWRGVAGDSLPAGLPAPATCDPTQWLFGGWSTTLGTALQVAVARMLGYRWPEQTPNGMFEQHADSDGIVCLPAVSNERLAADRLHDLLAAAYGAEWTSAKQVELLAAAGSPNATLGSWLRDDFFAQHCALFHQRPFIWHIWDGRKDGFAALVNYHKLDRHALQTLIYTYLGDWIARQGADAEAGKPGADLRLAAAQALQRKLELILEGEPPYDVFVRWKPVEQQPIGWDPDLNDGVRLNIRPFVVADVLRKRPTIKWGKDRGRNPPGSPWGEERFNSYEEHFPGQKLTNAMKLAARAAAARSAGAGV